MGFLFDVSFFSARDSGTSFFVSVSYKIEFYVVIFANIQNIIENSVFENVFVVREKYFVAIPAGGNN